MGALAPWKFTKEGSGEAWGGKVQQRQGPAGRAEHAGFCRLASVTVLGDKPPCDEDAACDNREGRKL